MCGIICGPYIDPTPEELAAQREFLTSAKLAERNSISYKNLTLMESDTGRSKTGDGIRRWNDLPYNDA